MILIPEPTKVKLELMSNEIKLLIEEMERQPHNIYEYNQTEKLINKLKIAIQREETDGKMKGG